MEGRGVGEGGGVWKKGGMDGWMDGWREAGREGVC